MALDEIKKARLAKLSKIRELGMDPYPRLTSRTHTNARVLAEFDALAASRESITVAGRLRAMRAHGGSTFVTLHDGTGAIQGYLKRDVMGEAYNQWLSLLDIGDFISVSGYPFRTQRNEPTIEASTVTMLTKSLLPLPEKWYGLENVEERYRKRYLDLLANEEVRQRFTIRSALVTAIRSFLAREAFVEAETPILQPIPGGTMARPFETRLHALDMRLYLRIAPELYLKRLLVAGFPKVFELGRNFRNEGMDRDHNPEFTMLECYEAYIDDQEMLAFIERFVHSVIQEATGSSQVPHKNAQINFTPPWQRILFDDLLKERTGLAYKKDSLEQFRERAKTLQIEVTPEMTKGKIADEIIKKAVRPHIMSPLIVQHYPLELSPLAKSREQEPSEVARFQILAGGTELVNGWAELNNPLEQERRFKAQEATRERGDEEAHRLDKDFLEALSYGMPPAAGFGMGIDRLVAVITDAPSLREIILFPTMRPKSS